MSEIDKNEPTLLENIRSGYDTFSKGQKRIAGYILDNYVSAAYMTAARLSKETGVSESTVVRFATELGYEGYPEMQSALQGMLKNRLTPVQRINLAAERIGDDILGATLRADIANLKATLAQTDRDNFAAIVDMLLYAKTIYIVGNRSSTSLANFMYFYFSIISDKARLVQNASGSDIFEQLLRIDEGDVLVAISFPRYSRRTVDAMHFARDAGAFSVAITDCEQSPIGPSGRPRALRAQRNGLVCRFARRAALAHQRARQRRRAEASARGLQYLFAAGGHLGKIQYL